MEITDAKKEIDELRALLIPYIATSSEVEGAAFDILYNLAWMIDNLDTRLSEIEGGIS